jgi:DNA-directed RNA polymerase subunit E'/Rpb7
MIEQGNDFNWEMYDDGFKGGNRLIPNLKIKGADNTNNKCFSREPYAQKLFDIYTGQKTTVKKDLVKGDCVLITDIFNIKETEMDIEIAGGLSMTIDLNREKRFVQIFGFDSVLDFTNRMNSSSEYVKSMLRENLLAYVIDSTPTVKVSLWQGYLMGIREEFMDQINNPSKAYSAKIKEANKGGFFVEVQGIDAFMPGSLAAANKIQDFQSYVGKEVIVMVEDYLKDMKSFIVSHKKYISHVLPQKLSEIDTMKKYLGTITGTSKYGIFIEFEIDEFIFTGLLHVSKMRNETQNLFKFRHYKAGDPIEFYVGEVTKDNRVILTEEDPQIKLQKIQQFIFESQDKVLDSEIAAVMKFGVIVNAGEVTGLIPLKEFKKQRVFINNFVVNDKIKVIFDEFKDEKIVFKLPPNGNE